MDKDKNVTRPKSTRDYYNSDKHKKESRIESKLKCGDIGINCIIKYK